MNYNFIEEIKTAYLSGSTSQFILHGNVNDRFIYQSLNKQLPEIGSLVDLITNTLLGTFDVVIHYDVGSGIKLLKTDKSFKADDLFNTKTFDPSKCIPEIGVFFNYMCNLKQINNTNVNIACIINSADLVVPNPNGVLDYNQATIVSQLRDWAANPKISAHNIVTFLITPTINQIHPLVSKNPRALNLNVPLPDQNQIMTMMDIFKYNQPVALEQVKFKLESVSSQLVGTTLSALDNFIRIKNYKKEPITEKDIGDIKNHLISQDCGDLLEIIVPKKTLNDYYGNEKLVEYLKQDIDIWKSGDIQAMSMGYLLCGPVGTGKTYFIECLAGSANVPVVKLKNFRDKFQGSTESNLEKIFNVIKSIGKVIVFVDEADQTLGKRDQSSSDGGVSGRVYAMFAEQMSNPYNRGKIIWLLATSRPDLLEVDLKRPGRIDVKIPIFPTSTQQESWSLITKIANKNGMNVNGDILIDTPEMLTPGAADALVMTAYREYKIKNISGYEAIKNVMKNWKQPVNEDIIKQQIKIAIDETTNNDFIPERFK